MVKQAIGTIIRNATDGQIAEIEELLGELELNDAENSVRNATRCINEYGHIELQNIVYDNFYFAGMNHVKNEIRSILGLPAMRTELEQRQIEYDIKHPMGSKVLWDCPELQQHEFEIVEGSAKLIPLGDDGSSMMVIGTKDRKKALRMMRRYERDWMDEDLLPEDRDIELKKVVWRSASDEDGEHTHMYSWRGRDTKNNSKAISAFIFEG